MPAVGGFGGDASPTVARFRRWRRQVRQGRAIELGRTRVLVDIVRMAGFGGRGVKISKTLEFVSRSYGWLSKARNGLCAGGARLRQRSGLKLGVRT